MEDQDNSVFSIIQYYILCELDYLPFGDNFSLFLTFPSIFPFSQERCSVLTKYNKSANVGFSWFTVFSEEKVKKCCPCSYHYNYPKSLEYGCQDSRFSTVLSF